jgi:hypothetical protein
MKYMQDGGFQNNPLMRLTLGLTLALLLGFWCTNVAMYFSRMSLSPSSVVAYYNGSEEDFRPPRSAASMLETTHTHLPMMGIVLLFLTHLAIFVPAAPAAKKAFIFGAFGSAVLEEGAGWLVRFVSPAFAPLKIVGFLGLQAAILGLVVALGVFVATGSRARTGRKKTGAEARVRRAPVVEDESEAPAVVAPISTSASR